MLLRPTPRLKERTDGLTVHAMMQPGGRECSLFFIQVRTLFEPDIQYVVKTRK